jgi:hypothetical protein
MKKIAFFALMALCLSACQKEAVQPKVYGRYVPERKDDFAWENEYAAFRMYGPALRPENPSNGVDLWLKASPELIVDSFYYREHVLGFPYHINYGKGLDCYKVGHTCGAGGLVVTIDEDPEDRIYVGGAYDRWEILEQSPERFVFRLEYDSLMVHGHLLKEQITITAEAGKILNKAEVVLTGDNHYEGIMWVGGGIYLHDGADTANIYYDSNRGIATYAEDALSDKTAAQMNYEYNGSTSQGTDYLALFNPRGATHGIQDDVLYALNAYTLGDTLTYYFGACWSQWSDGERSFPDKESWLQAIQEEASTL